jgi:glutathione synthase/RimK-type ligase-like ATP-grasp enzyme
VYHRSKNKNYLRSQLLLQEIFEENGIQLIRVRPNKYDKKNKLFTQRWRYGADSFEIINENISPDALRNRSLHTISLLSVFGDRHLLPHAFLSIFAADKFQQATVCKEWMPRTVLLGEFLSSVSVQECFDEKLVLKYRYGSGGKDISVVSKTDLLTNPEIYLPKKKDYVVQEYIDFSGWIPDLANGVHDFRIVILWADKKYVEVRQPANDAEFRSNIALGGSMALYGIEVIPDELRIIADKIIELIQLLCGVNIFCSLDFGYAAGRRWLIEVNSSPGIEFDENDKQRQKAVYKDLAQYFLALPRQ